MIIRNFSKDDFYKIKVQKEQKHELNFSIMPPENCFVMEDAGEVLGIFGFVEMYKGRGLVFSFISQNAGRKMISIVRSLKKIIVHGSEKFGFERLEMSVADGFVAGTRMALMLGFEYEGMMRKYFKGRNYKLFARVR